MQLPHSSGHRPPDPPHPGLKRLLSASARPPCSPIGGGRPREAILGQLQTGGNIWFYGSFLVCVYNIYFPNALIFCHYYFCMSRKFWKKIRHFVPKAQIFHSSRAKIIAKIAKPCQNKLLNHFTGNPLEPNGFNRYR